MQNPKDSMQKLLDGIHEFSSTVYESERELFETLANGQNPKVFFVTCSDSRIDPHLVTQTKPGDLFVLRNAGNFVPEDTNTGEGATIEYAAGVLPDVHHMIVCGHSDCGAVKASLNPPAKGQFPAIDSWLENANEVKDILETRPGYADWSEQERIDRAIEINALVQLRRLSQQPSVKARLDKGNLQLHAWVYDIGRGEVRAFDSEAGEFRRIEGARPIAAGELANLPALA